MVDCGLGRSVIVSHRVWSSDWMSSRDLKLAPEKTEVVMITKKWAYTMSEVKVNGHNVHYRKSLRYIDVQIDPSDRVAHA
jgi:hypothetical protein